MNQSSVKLTIRIPNGLHKLLQKRARERKRSLNTEVVESLRIGVEKPDMPLNQRERVLQTLRERGLLASGTPTPAPETGRTYKDWRKQLAGVTLSDAVREERESQP